MSLIQNLADAADFTTRSYSGRGMFGKECLGVVLDEGMDTGAFFAALLEELQSFVVKMVEEKNDTTSAEVYFTMLTESLKNMKTDNLGKSTIVYFPSIAYTP